MDGFTTWASLASYGGAVALVALITQVTKNMQGIKKIPTFIWSYIIALFILYPATYFTGGLTADNAVLILFNAAFVSLGANGGFEAVTRLSGSTDGTLTIQKTAEENEKDQIVLSLDTSVNDKNTLRIKVNQDEKT